jgi:transcriptional regulator with XRE-family HTH domain
MSLSERLRQRRTTLGYTLPQFAVVLGLSAEILHRLEHGTWTYVVPLALRRRLAEVLGCAVEDLGLAEVRRRKEGGTLVPVATETLGGCLTALRSARGLTQQALADRMHVCATSICRWERDHVRPGPRSQARLARALQCRIDDFMPSPPAAVGGRQEEL